MWSHHTRLWTLQDVYHSSAFQLSSKWTATDPILLLRSSFNCKLRSHHTCGSCRASASNVHDFGLQQERKWRQAWHHFAQLMLSSLKAKTTSLDLLLRLVITYLQMMDISCTGCALCIQPTRTSIFNLFLINFVLTLTNIGFKSNWLKLTWRYKLLLPVSIWIPLTWVLCLGRPHRRFSIHFCCYGMTQHWRLSSFLLF